MESNTEALKAIFGMQHELGRMSGNIDQLLKDKDKHEAIHKEISATLAIAINNDSKLNGLYMTQQKKIQELEDEGKRINVVVNELKKPQYQTKIVEDIADLKMQEIKNKQSFWESLKKNILSVIAVLTALLVTFLQEKFK